MIPIVRDIVEAHGGMDLWGGLEAVEAEVSASGFLFTAKRRPVLRHVRVRAYTREPRFVFYGFPLPAQTAELRGNEEVLIRDARGEVVARRVKPRLAFRGLRRLLYWDSLDFTYFGGYATWNYLTAPFLFMREGFAFKELGPLPGSRLYRLLVTFPEDIPTHCPEQVFYFDEGLLIRRIDYTAEVVGRWARAAHLCEGYGTFGGIRAPTRRKVLPLFSRDNPLPWPILVCLEMHDIRPLAAGAEK